MKPSVTSPSTRIQRVSHCESAAILACQGVGQQGYAEAGVLGNQGQVSHCPSSNPENALIESVEMVNGRPDPRVFRGP